MREISGGVTAEGLRFGIVVSRFNETVTEKLLQGAVQWLVRAGARREDMTVVRVPGSFEIPLAASKLAAVGGLDAIICLGALIQGETDHYGHLAATVTAGVSRVALDAALPVSFGVLTTATVEQALNRAGVKYGNKGAEAAIAAVEMVHVVKALG